jgi:hypothetical protein
MQLVLQEWTLLNTQLAKGEKLQRAWRQRLAGVIESGSVVAVRHSDGDFPDYQYYMAIVRKVCNAILGCSKSVSDQPVGCLTSGSVDIVPSTNRRVQCQLSANSICTYGSG